MIPLLKSTSVFQIVTRHLQSGLLIHAGPALVMQGGQLVSTHTVSLSHTHLA